MSASPKLISANDLETQRRAGTGPTVLDVRLAEDHARDRIPGALNNCVFEVGFGERMRTLAPDKNTPLCIYGANEESQEAVMACEKLNRAGYTRVSCLDGGIAAWTDAGFPTEGTHEAVDAPAIPVGRRVLDLGESRVEWLGRNLLNKHRGSIAIKSGYLDFDGTTITGGEVVISMRDIHCDDLAGTPLHDVLVAHLRSDDFFDTERFPEAKIVLRSARFDPSAAPGGQNLNVEADLTLKGVTAPVSFTASAGLDADGHLAAQASFAIDRTQWGVLYGSGKFFHRLSGHLVNDLIEIQLRMVAMA
jgi:polyisoprenoid-binding protein YceI/rhodanese-related sulfurtransferase